jgi:hypothetical protein
MPLAENPRRSLALFRGFFGHDDAINAMTP